MTSGESFANVKRWLHEIEQNCDVVNRVLGMSTTDILHVLWMFHVITVTKLIILAHLACEVLQQKSRN